MAFAFRAKNLGPLRDIDWRIPRGVSVVVGPNGVGKSTLLRLPEFARVAVRESLNDAVTQVFEGTAHLRHHGAAPDAPIEFGASTSYGDWDVTLNVAGATVSNFSAEVTRVEGTRFLERAAGAADVSASRNQMISWGSQTLLGGTLDRFLSRLEDIETLIRSPKTAQDDVAKSLATIIKLAPVEGRRLARVYVSAHRLAFSCSTFQTYRYQLTHIAKYGSPQTSALALQPNGENIFPLLRNWRDSSDNEPRFEFVLSTLREAFPHVKKLDFEQAGQTVTASIVDSRYPGNKKTHISRESTGLLVALLHLCAIASCPKGGLVTLDELETSLHPHAIKVLIAAFRAWAQQHDLSIVLATQSETVLDQFHDEPEKIFVLEPQMTPAPKPLTELFSREWLSQFSLGDLFGHLEYGSHRTE
ncbi:MAG TPA: AAA family ATPase [Nannocystis sp.]